MQNEKIGIDPLLPHSALTKRVLVNFYDVYNEVGYGFLEAVYQKALAIALRHEVLHIDVEVPTDVFFRGAVIGQYRADLIVDAKVIVEIKSARSILPEHERQLLNYLRGTAIEVGLLLNFGPRPQFKRFLFTNDRKRSIMPNEPV